MSDEALALPLARFPLLGGDPLPALRAELERALDSAQRGPWMVLAGTSRERLAVLRAGLEPGACARVEQALLTQPGVQWTALCGEAWLPAPGGALRYGFVRLQRSAGGWQVGLRPFMTTLGQLIFLDDWALYTGGGPPEDRLRHLFPDPDAGPVRFVRATGELPSPSDTQPIPPGAPAEDITRVAGLWLESFFFSRGFVPPAAVAVVGQELRVYVLPRTAPAHAAGDLAIRLAQEPEVKAVGVFHRERDVRIQPPAEQIGVWLEWRGGPGLLWRRRFRLVAANTARWLDAQGEVSAPRVRRLWFAEAAEPAPSPGLSPAGKGNPGA